MSIHSCLEKIKLKKPTKYFLLAPYNKGEEAGRTTRSCSSRQLLLEAVALFLYILTEFLHYMTTKGPERGWLEL